MLRLFAIVPYRMVLAVILGGDIVIAMAFAMLLNTGEPVDPGLMVGISVGIPVAVLLLVIPLVTVMMRPWR